MMNQINSNQVLKVLICLTTLIPTVGAAQTTDHHLTLAHLSPTATLTAENDTTESPSERKKQAIELLGRLYRKSEVRKNGEKIASMNNYIYEWTGKELKPQWKKYSRTIASAIMAESKKHKFDPVFLMAVIENESSFNPEVVGSFGEIGLMQITPQTADWISKKYNVAYKGPKSLKNPATNIALGSAYLSYLRAKFGFKGQLYLAAYNMGSKNVQRLLAQQKVPEVYPKAVMKRYVRFYTKIGANHTNVALN
jgi:soluble lytic murein transglycosylase